MPALSCGLKPRLVEIGNGMLVGGCVAMSEVLNRKRLAGIAAARHLFQRHRRRSGTWRIAKPLLFQRVPVLRRLPEFGGTLAGNDIGEIDEEFSADVVDIRNANDIENGKLAHDCIKL